MKWSKLWGVLKWLVAHHEEVIAVVEAAKKPKTGPTLTPPRVGSVILLCLLTTTAWAQVGPAIPGTSQLCWDHDGQRVVDFKLAIDGGAGSSIGLPTPTGEAYCVPFPALTPGTHAIVVQACNEAGCAGSDPFSIVVVVLPAKPTNVRIRS